MALDYKRVVAEKECVQAEKECALFEVAELKLLNEEKKKKKVRDYCPCTILILRIMGPPDYIILPLYYVFHHQTSTNWNFCLFKKNI